MKLFQQVQLSLRIKHGAFVHISSQWYYYKLSLCNDITNKSGYLGLWYKTCCIQIPFVLMTQGHMPNEE